MTPAEFECVYKEYQETREAAYKDDWARMRMLAAIVIQPHLKRKITPEKLLPFPWEKRRGESSREKTLNRYRQKKARRDLKCWLKRLAALALAATLEGFKISIIVRDAYRGEYKAPSDKGCYH